MNKLPQCIQRRKLFFGKENLAAKTACHITLLPITHHKPCPADTITQMM
jgi:hypothetical protein